MFSGPDYICAGTTTATSATFWLIPNSIMADDDKSVDSDEEVEMKEEKAEPEVVEDATLTNPDVVTKYQEAAKIAQAVLVDLIPRVSQTTPLVIVSDPI